MEEKRNVPDVLSEVTLMLEILKEVQYAPYDKDVCVVGRYQFARRVLDNPEVKKALAEKKDKVLIEYDENGKGAAFNIYGKPIRTTIRTKRKYSLDELLAQDRRELSVDMPLALNNLRKGGVSTRTLINQDNSPTKHTIIDKPDVDDLKEKEDDFHVTPHIATSQAKDIVAPVKFNDGHVEEIHIQSLKTISGRPKKNNLEDYDA